MLPVLREALSRSGPGLPMVHNHQKWSKCLPWLSMLWGLGCMMDPFLMFPKGTCRRRLLHCWCLDSLHCLAQIVAAPPTESFHKGIPTIFYVFHLNSVYSSHSIHHESNAVIATSCQMTATSCQTCVFTSKLILDISTLFPRLGCTIMK